MDNKKFEQLIDLVINENEEQARALFHDIVVEKSREIYESMMDDEMEGQGMGGKVGDLLDEIDVEQTGMSEGEDDDLEFDSEEDEVLDIEDGEDDEYGDEMGGEEGLEDRVVDLEDKLDQLMAEFEAEFGDAEEEGEEEEEEEEEGEDSMMEAVELKKVSVTHGDNGSQTKSPVVANSGAKGPVGNVVKPVKFSGDTETVPTSAKGPSNYASKGEKMTGDKYQNSPGGATGTKAGKGEAAPKPKHEDNKSKSPVAESRRVAKKRI